MDLENKIRDFSYQLEEYEETGKINSFEFEYSMPVSEEIKLKLENESVSSKMLMFYEWTNGIKIKWIKDLDEGVFGQMLLINIENVVLNFKQLIYSENDLLENDLLQYYRPMDFVSPEVTSGILITPDFTSRSIYCHINGEADLFDLDLDIDGYIEMALEAKVFNLWTIVLIQIQKEEQGAETKSFKENMPIIFPNFDWDNFIKKYKSLRLSNREE